MTNALCTIEKLLLIQKYIKNQFNKDTKVIDLGGVRGYYDQLCIAVSPSKPYIMNLSANAIEGISNSYLGDACHTGFPNESWDIVIALDIIEHLEEPADLIIEARRILKNNGILIIGTPNLACLFNRLSLMMGFSPYLYAPSKYRVASPFAKVSFDDSGHKSVLTYRGLKELITILGFDCIHSDGYSYSSETKYYSENNCTDYQPNKCIRHDNGRILLNQILPNEMKEASFLICRKK
jgi:SAM-dependent methyltransferase